MTASPPLAGVIGWPIGHSRSPKLHGHWLARYGIEGYYVPIGLPPEAFAEGLRALQRLGFVGVNVTIPHKEAALAFATRPTARATAVGAANTLTFSLDGSIEADNTDGYGFIANLRQQAPGWVGAAGAALVLGAGGGARGIVEALLSEGVPEVRVANRTVARAEALAAHFAPRVVVLEWEAAMRAEGAPSIVVNTTSLGMAGEPELPLRLDALPSGTVVTDIVYGAEPTALVREALRRGLLGVDGLGMLLHQAAPGFERWFGRRPEVDAALRAAVLA
jgi:shikimate dehydrogenase